MAAFKGFKHHMHFMKSHRIEEEKTMEEEKEMKDDDNDENEEESREVPIGKSRFYMSLPCIKEASEKEFNFDHWHNMDNTSTVMKRKSNLSHSHENLSKYTHSTTNFATQGGEFISKSFHSLLPKSKLNEKDTHDNDNSQSVRISGEFKKMGAVKLKSKSVPTVFLRSPPTLSPVITPIILSMNNDVHNHNPSTKQQNETLQSYPHPHHPHLSHLHHYINTSTDHNVKGSIHGLDSGYGSIKEEQEEEEEEEEVREEKEEKQGRSIAK